MIDETTRLTVVIITKDRADDLRNTSLPGLARQTFRAFDILVWDASSDDRTCSVVADEAARHPWMHIRHARAPRVGIACQRNDALDSCTSELILFVDDDVELLPIAVAELLRVFEADQAARVAGCQCTLVQDKCTTSWGANARRRMANIWYGIWGMWHVGDRQTVRLSGFNTSLRSLPHTEVERVHIEAVLRRNIEWLEGSTMMFRRDILVRHHLRFDEHLMRFGGYSRCEDLLLSGILHLRYGYDLALAPLALAIPRNGSGPHGGGANQQAMVVYNHWLVWHELMSQKRWSRLALAWAWCGLFLTYLLAALFKGKIHGIVSFRDGIRAARASSLDT